jgi:uncharacterized membrane protein
MLLSHHAPAQYCRTYKIGDFRICARCLGIPMGLILGFVWPTNNLYWLALLPLPTFINFYLQEMDYIPSLNILKTMLTIPLGVFIYSMIYNIFNASTMSGLAFVVYLIIIQIITIILLNRKGRMDRLIKIYEDGIYL